MNKEIEAESWKEYFMTALGRVGHRIVKGDGKENRAIRVKEEEISREEIRKAINRLRDEKAAGIDGIPGKVWKYGKEEL